MSFILDALRKSDNERREQATPALAAAPQAVAIQKRSIWLPILAVVLMVNALVFGTIFLTRDEPTPVAATALPSVEPEVRSLRKEILVDSATGKPTNTPAEKMTSSEPAITPVPAASGSTDGKVAAPEPALASSKTIQEGLPSLGQLQAAGLVSTPNLRVDMHVYSGDATKRFVFINMTKYREGDRLPEGPTIEEITPEGIIMDQQGNRFQLDRD
jgi:general secretion pathway protein B